MSNWDDINDEDLFELHKLLGLAGDVKSDEDALSVKLDKLNVLYEYMKKLSIDFIIKLSDKIAEIIHERAKENLGSQENT